MTRPRMRFRPAALLCPVRPVGWCGLARWGRYEVGVVRHNNINNERSNTRA